MEVPLRKGPQETGDTDGQDSEKKKSVMDTGEKEMCLPCFQKAECCVCQS